MAKRPPKIKKGYTKKRVTLHKHLTTKPRSIKGRRESRLEK